MTPIPDAPEPWYERLNPWLVAAIIVLLFSIPSTVEWWLQ